MAVISMCYALSKNEGLKPCCNRVLIDTKLYGFIVIVTKHIVTAVYMLLLFRVNSSYRTVN